MRHIYAYVKMVLVWLGLRTADSDEAIKALKAGRRFARRTFAYREEGSVWVDMRKVPCLRHP
jgi:hypothetical protein